MLELPPKIKIGYKYYTVEGMPPESREKNIGFCLPQQHLIQVATDLLPSEVANTFIHEFIHAIFDMSGFVFESDESQENITNCVANGLTQIFVDNPDVIKWIIENCQRDINERTSSPRSNTTSTDTSNNNLESMVLQ
jgi:hypothetical protein